MKMAKASATDIEAAGDAMSVLNDISSGYFPARQDDVDAPTFFDPDDRDHLVRFYDTIKATLDASPGWQNRIIGGMCFVVLYDKNQIVDPDDDCLALHPRFAAVTAQRDALLAAAQAARAMITVDRRALADCETRTDGTFEADATVALAEYDAVLAQIDAAIGLEQSPVSGQQQVLTDEELIAIDVNGSR